jgi:PhoPQ-activated pathogenicity-related protein
MDTAQDFMVGGVGKATEAAPISNFLVTGYSKRGWTTWLTAAVDDRVRAIVPGVFDNLNQGEQMAHHYGVYGFFSEAVHDYNDLEIFHRILTPQALELSQITDPYRYLNNGRFDDMPILVMNSAGDEFFVSDSSQFYFHDLPGTQNYLRYVPNVGHGMGLTSGNTSALESTVAFYDAVANNQPLPEYSWVIDQDGTIRVQTDTAPLAVKLWQITNPNARDFRRAATPGLNWSSSILSDLGNGTYAANLDTPGAGATAYFIELTFASGTLFPHVFTTDIRVKSVTPWHPWPFASGLGAPPADPLVAATLLEPVDTITAGLVMSGNAVTVSANVPADSYGAAVSSSAAPALAPRAAEPLLLSAAGALDLASAEIDAEADELTDYLVDDELLSLLA